MIAEGYGDRRTLERRIQGMEKWLANPATGSRCRCSVRRSDRHEFGIIKEPIPCAPNDRMTPSADYSTGSED
ncbi:hypothetical protein ACLK19_00910 [Escherichia coli]